MSLISVFQERPELPPTQAQATARSIPPEDYSYITSIRRLLHNWPFILLIVTYGQAVATVNRSFNVEQSSS